MNKKGAWVATLTVAFLFVYLFSTSMLMKRSVGDVKVEDTGKLSGIAINLNLKEEEIRFFLEKAFEYSAFNALKDLGADGGTSKKLNCEKIDGHVIWRGDCYFDITSMEDVFFERFEQKFNDYAKENNLKINSQHDYDSEGKFFLKTNGIIELQEEGIRYGFEPGIIFYPEYNFNIYADILRKVNDCLKKEREKGSARNNLFEDCRDDK